MTNALIPLSPEEAHRRLAGGHAVLIDIREPDEFARRHIAGAISHPLSRSDDLPTPVQAGQQRIFTCRSGMRTAGACDRLAASVPGQAFVLEGGIDAWDRAGLPIAGDKHAPIEIMRQVQIAAGSLVLLGLLAGWLVAPLSFGVAAFVGAGLIFAGVTGFCGMARLLMLAPWNRRARAA